MDLHSNLELFGHNLYSEDEEANSKAWITFKVRGQKGERATLKPMYTIDETLSIRSDSDKFEVKNVKSKSLTVQVKNQDLLFKVVAPFLTFHSIHSKNINSLDVSSGGLGVSAGDDGLLVWETNTGLIRRKLEGHVGEIYSVRLFPSGIVVLSCGADMRIKIWSAETGSCPVTLTGHTSAVTQTAILDRGRNIVSCSKDGKIRIWSCGQGQTIEPVIEANDVINCIDVQETNLDIVNRDEPEDPELECGTLGKIAVIGGESGSVQLLDLRNRSVIKSVNLNSAVNAVKFLNDENTIAVGTQDGKLTLLRIPDLMILTEKHDSDSSLECLLPLRNGVLCGKYDGACVWYSIDNNGHAFGQDLLILSGADVDPIHDMAQDEDYVYTAARDGCIRKYRKSDMF